MTTISLVTGASRGIGRNTAISIARHGGDVILTYRNQAEEAKTAVAAIEALGRKAVALQLDITNVSSFDRSRTGYARHFATSGTAIHSTTSSTMPATARWRASRRRPKRSSTLFSTRM
jgi:NAD(P)-dependent dehydrogenase (short-subunit alcohol dehydrogenase family)